MSLLCGGGDSHIVRVEPFYAMVSIAATLIDFGERVTER